MRGKQCIMGNNQGVSISAAVIHVAGIGVPRAVVIVITVTIIITVTIVWLLSLITVTVVTTVSSVCDVDGFLVVFFFAIGTFSATIATVNIPDVIAE